MKEKINIETFAKVEIRAGRVVEAERVEGSEKLLKLAVDFGEESKRQVVSGIAKYIAPDDLVGKTVGFVTNLEPREIMGLESEAMILASSGDGYFSLLEFKEGTPPGSSVK